MRGPYPKNDVFIFWMGFSQSVYLPLTSSLTAMDFAAKLTGQLDFVHGGHVGVYVGRAAHHTCWYRLDVKLID